ncbi:MAG: caspase family protein [Pseudomonadota bacterium]
MGYVVFVLAIVLSALSGAPVLAQGWQPLAPQYGTGYVSCAQTNGAYECLSFQCHPKRGLEFGHYTNQPGALSLAVATTDQGTTEVLRWRDVGVPGMKVQNYSHYGMAEFLASLAKSQTLTFQTASTHSLSVAGGAQVVNTTLAACQSIENRRYPKSLSEIEKDAAQFAKEIRPEQTELTYLYETDSWGNDLAQYSGLDRNGCTQQCLGRADCKLATFNDTKNICFLKSDFGTLRSQSDAFTTYVSRRPTLVRQPGLPGPAPVTTESLRASPLVPWQDTVEALRNASIPLGGTCEAELATVQRMASTLQMQALPTNAIAGQVVPVGWTNTPMDARVPAWMVISSERPIRFDGEGFFGLNAGGIGPFGLSLDSDRQRAFAPLYTADTKAGVKIGLRPLEAGTYPMRVTLVTYLRACKQEIPLVQADWEITVTPAAPEIVLRDITETYPYDRRIDVPELGRRIEFNDTRFQIQFLEDGSEVLAREGKNLRLSPTKRFAVIYDNAELEIIDIVDGTTVANVKGIEFAFWNADSFFLTDRAPWGEMTVGATMLPRIFKEGVRTGGSCCGNNGSSDLFVDLENNFVVLQGGAASLLSEKLYLGQTGKLTYATKPASPTYKPTTLSKTFQPSALAVIDAVSPVQTSYAWSLPLGPYYMTEYAFGNVRKADDPEDAALALMSQDRFKYIKNPEFGLSHDRLSSAPENVLLRGMRGNGETKNGFSAALARIGVDLHHGVSPETYLRMRRGGVEALEMTVEESQAYDRTMLQLEADVSGSGKSVKWARLVKEEGQIGHFCEHFPNEETEPTASALSASEIGLAHRFARPGRIVWITRATCLGGTLGSNLVSASELNIFDTLSDFKVHGEYRADHFATWGSNFYARGIFETGFDAKLFHDRYAVTYAPGEGAILVFDLTTREFLMRLRYARRGDLLENVFLDASAQHLYQLNTNGSFTVYRLADGAPILEGRYLDDEIVIWTASFHFDSTEEGAAFVELRFPGQPGQYSFQQFSNAQRIPGLMSKVLDGSITLANIDVGIPPRISGRINGTTGRLDGMVLVEANAPVQQVRIFQDGVQTDQLPVRPGQLTPIRTARIPGTRWVSVVAEDELGLVSLPLNVDLGASIVSTPQVHFFGVGIDHYETEQLDPLNYAKRDVLTLSDTLKQMDGTTIKLASSTLLGDRKASADAILSKLQATVEAAQPGDHLILFFAGHGLRDASGAFFLGLSETKLDDLAGTGLAWQKLARLIARRDIRVTVLLDACHAGAAGSDAFATNDEAVDALIGPNTANVTVIAAAKGRQFSGESSEVGGGFFTAAIRDVMLEKRDEFDENGNGALEAVEFYRGVKTLVTARRGSEQTPWMVRNQLVGDYALF